MSTTQHTGHYNLPTFGDNPNDRPSWRGDFTDAMTKIDNQLYANATNITTATAAANNAKVAADAAKESADNATELAQANKTDIGELDGYFSKLGVTSPQTAQQLMNTINGKAENTALTALQGTVSTLSDKVDGKAESSNVYTKAQADTTFTKQGGYSGTAQELNTAINGVSSSFEQFKTNGQAPISIGRKEQGEFYGLQNAFTAYYSPITHLVVVRGGLHGTTTSNIPAGGHKLGTIDKSYAPVNFDIQAICDYNIGSSGDGARLEVRTDGTVWFRNWKQVNTGNPIDSDACVAYYVLSR